MKSLGEQMVYAILLMYHAYGRKETPNWAKNIILSSFAYLLAPFDAIPDLTPFLGYTDDLSVMMFGLVSISCFINDDVRLKAKTSLSKVCKNYDPLIIAEVDQRL
ncbi:MAG TPA: DUF1232 domain-containing protein [Saprospiraceae bacterium]|nr:DUF1232 domain-containing protein [Saprospiraceae bacterium]